MEILLLTHYFEPENGAPQRRWAALSKRFVAQGHTIRVLTPSPHYPSGKVLEQHRELRPGTIGQSSGGAIVHRVAYLNHAGDMLTRTLDHFVAAIDTYRRATQLYRRRTKPNVIIATAPALETLIVGRVLARRLDAPLVAEMRDAWPDLVAHTPGLASSGRPRSLVKRRVQEFVTRLQSHADAVVATTSTFARVLASRGIESVAVLRNGTESGRYAAVPGAVRSDAGELRILYMGTIGRSQGLDRIVMAASRLRDEGIAVEVRLVGPGADVGRLRKLNADLGSPVRIFGQIEGHQVLDQYAWADTTVVSLRDWEPFAWTVPSKLYELMAAGKHITAIVAGEAADLVRSTGAGDVIAPGDVESLVALWQVIARDRTRLNVGENGRSWIAENAEYDGLAADYLRLLETLVESRGGNR